MFNARSAWSMALFLLLLALPPATAARADDIDALLERSRSLYREGRLGEALNEVEAVSALMRQKKAELLRDVFPPAPEGWTADSPLSQAVAKVFMGGGITASRLYRQRRGNGQVKLEVVSDSPLMQGVGLILTNPMLAQAVPGAKLVRLGRENALLTSQGPQRAELQLVVDAKLLVRAEASGLEQPAQAAQDFMARLDLDKLRRWDK